jgi:excisionase family DNA binding protein
MAELLCTLEVARLLGCGPDYVRWLARRGRIPVALQTRAGRLYRRDDVECWAKERRDRESQTTSA